MDVYLCAYALSQIRLCAILQTVAHQTPLSLEFSRQEYWSGLAFPSPGDLPNPGVKPRSPELQEDSLPSEPPGKPQENHLLIQPFLGVGSHSLLQGIIPTQIEPRSPALQADSLPSHFFLLLSHV